MDKTYADTVRLLLAVAPDGHLSEKEVTRRLTDRQTRAEPVKGRKNSTDLDLPGGHWTQHDLRRTGATIMGELGFAKEVIDRCLNHKEPKKVTRTYQRQQMMPQRQAAFEALGAHLAKLLGDPNTWLPDGMVEDETPPTVRRSRLPAAPNRSPAAGSQSRRRAAPT